MNTDKILSKEEIIGRYEFKSAGKINTIDALTSMDEWAKQTAIAFMMWYGGNDKESCTRIYEMFFQSQNKENNQ